MSSRDYDVTHGKILESGRIHFLEFGFEKANLRDISKDAGVTTGAFYRHFKDKEALFSEIINPLIEDIQSFYEKFKEESFTKYDLNGITKESIEDVLDVKVRATLETVMFLYDYKDLCDLLIFKSFGTKYYNFLDSIIEKEDRNIRKSLVLIWGEENVDEVISRESIHLLNHAYLHALTSIVSHAKTKEEARNNAVTISTFFRAGWEKYRNP